MPAKGLLGYVKCKIQEQTVGYHGDWWVNKALLAAVAYVLWRRVLGTQQGGRGVANGITDLVTSDWHLLQAKGGCLSEQKQQNSNIHCYASATIWLYCNPQCQVAKHSGKLPVQVLHQHVLHIANLNCLEALLVFVHL